MVKQQKTLKKLGEKVSSAKSVAKVNMRYVSTKGVKDLCVKHVEQIIVKVMNEAN